MTQFVSKQEVIQALKLSGTTLRRYRVQGVLIECIHWVRVNSRCIRYNLELIQDWLHNRHGRFQGFGGRWCRKIGTG